MKAWLLNPDSWTQLTKRYSHDDDLLYRNRRNIVFSQIMVVGVAVGLGHSIEGLFDSSIGLALLDFSMTAIVFGIYQINEAGHHFKAKILLFSFLNLFFFIYSLVVPRELGIFAFYFPWVTAAALVFTPEERRWQFFFIGISISCVAVLLASDFSLLSRWRMNFIQPGNLFLINMMFSLVATAFFVFLMVRISADSEQRLRNLASEVRQKNEQLQKTIEQLDRFVYNASHDLQLPIVAIKGLTNLARMEDADSRTSTYLNRINNQTDKLSMFLLEMLSYARNDRTEVSLEHVNLHELVDETIEAISHLDNASRIEFRKFVRVDGSVLLDRVRFTLILSNLLSNAIKHHNYEIENPWVKVMISKAGDSLQIMVADNGYGIKDEHQEKVFEMFFRASDDPLNSGLGLFIVKEAVEKLNGRIMLSSKVGEGSCFRVDLPFVA